MPAPVNAMASWRAPRPTGPSTIRPTASCSTAALLPTSRTPTATAVRLAACWFAGNQAQRDLCVVRLFRLRSECTTAKRRFVKRHLDEDALVQMNARATAKLMASRRCTAEHPFGTVKRMMAGGRFLTRNLKGTPAMRVTSYQIGCIVSETRRFHCATRRLGRGNVLDRDRHGCNALHIVRATRCWLCATRGWIIRDDLKVVARVARLRVVRLDRRVPFVRPPLLPCNMQSAASYCAIIRPASPTKFVAINTMIGSSLRAATGSDATPK